MTDVQVLLMFLFLDSKMAKQQLQKWELKFVVIAKVNEAWRLPPFWGQETTPKTEAALCVFLKVLQNWSHWKGPPQGEAPAGGPGFGSLPDC